MHLLVGLGNPGPEYVLNRHNIGFMAVDCIHYDYGFSPWRSKFQGQLSEKNLGGDKVLLFKPFTFMNNSGQAIEAAVQFYKIPLTDIIVFHDELDLAAGKIRIKHGGGHAGHNGLRSINSHIGDGYTRVRLGIGHPGDKNKVVGHVLKNFSKSELPWVERMMAGISDHIQLLLSGDDERFMSKVAHDIQSS